MRLPHTGQSFRSFCESWSHQLQNRRFSTVQGNWAGVGASGINSPTTSSGSPVSRSMYTCPGSASMITSRPVEGVRIRYFWRDLIAAQCYQRPRRRRLWARVRGSAGMPHAWIECGPERMVKAVPRPVQSLLALVASAVALVGLGGCAIKHPTSDLVKGKVLFVEKCGACHTLAHANTTGTIGPNLDDAFRQDRIDGVKSTSIQGLIDFWVRYPDTEGAMPAMLFKGQDAQDVAAYVGHVAARPGVDTGQLASA